MPSLPLKNGIRVKHDLGPMSHAHIEASIRLDDKCTCELPIAVLSERPSLDRNSAPYAANGITLAEISTTLSLSFISYTACIRCIGRNETEADHSLQWDYKQLLSSRITYHTLLMKVTPSSCTENAKEG